MSTRLSGGPKFAAGETVRVLPREDIAKAYDPATGALEGCLFMAQMGDYCGRTFRVMQVIDSFFNEHRHRTFRPRSPLYLLENVTCHGKVGEFADKCDHRCYLLWHEEWLQSPGGNGGDAHYDKSALSPSAAGSAGCQLQLIDQIGNENTWLNEKLQYSVRKYRYYRRKVLSRLKPNSHALTSSTAAVGEIRPGDLVRVRPVAEIKSSLDKARKTRGCTFQDRMYEYCGKEFRVAEKVDHFFDESKQKFCKCKNIFLLEGAYCNGQTAYLRPCDRNCYYFWQAGWLEKV